ncbi:transcriptional regulatory protein [Marinobacter nitratireducens]|uniref:Transcriptional regulatory protein n=1 Tax=Marinobacter nitratireducens TaxID=1137280 RepID=A0A072NFB9_9GAMM|nr:helix-turn-helix domain-containing protein [Marinobacter nitratireducens]KEF31800.1 transcriptional regulatory protein [Marinobacter nitratireducens]
MYALTGFGLGCLASLFLISLRDLRHVRVGQLFLLILIATSAYLIDPLIPANWRWITSDLQTTLPALFWLLCQVVFATRPKLFTVWGGMALYTFVSPAFSRPFIEAGTWPDWGVFLGWELCRWFEYVIVLHGLFYVVRHWRDDLVETRRKARLALLLVMGTAVTVATVSLNFGLYHEASRGTIVSLAALTILICFVSTREGLLDLAPQPSASTENPVSSEPLSENGEKSQEDARQLQILMAEGFYKEEKLTLKRLASELSIPEYRVRKVINETLGYRNFNDYINQLRIAEAARHLREQPDAPILNISLDVGYRTLSSFNRAFRDIMQTTPSAYRQGETPQTVCADS